MVPYDRGFGGDYDEINQKPLENFEIREFPYILNIIAQDVDLIVRVYVSEDGNYSPFKLHMTFDKTMKVLGTRRLLEFEQIKNIFEILSFSLNHKIFENLNTDLDEKQTETYKIFEYFSEQLMENNFFSKAVEDFFTYEWNNSYQKLFE